MLGRQSATQVEVALPTCLQKDIMHPMTKAHKLSGWCPYITLLHPEATGNRLLSQHHCWRSEPCRHAAEPAPGTHGRVPRPWPGQACPVACYHLSFCYVYTDTHTFVYIYIYIYIIHMYVYVRVSVGSLSVDTHAVCKCFRGSIRLQTIPDLGRSLSPTQSYVVVHLGASACTNACRV